MTNLADAEWQHAWLHEHPEPDAPTLADVAADQTPTVTDRRACVAAWVLHDRESWTACDYCQGRKPVCRWGGRSRCAHGRYIDDPGVRWDPDARRHFCDVLVTA